MTVPRCFGRRVRDSRNYSYNFTGIETNAIKKYEKLHKKQDRRDRKRLRESERGGTDCEGYKTISNHFTGYKQVTETLQWKKVKNSRVLVNPFTGQVKWNEEDTKPITIRRWVSTRA